MTAEEITLGITFDCADARVMTRFGSLALGYVEAPPPEGWATWSKFLTDHDHLVMADPEGNEFCIV